MSTSRRAITGLTLAVGLGVAVTTGQGTALADTTDAGSAPNDPTSPASASGPSEGAAAPETEADSDSQEDSKPAAKKKRPRALFDGTRITIRRDEVKPAIENDDAEKRQEQTVERDTEPVVDDDPDSAGADVETTTAREETDAHTSSSRNRSTPRASIAERPHTVTIDVSPRDTMSSTEPKPVPERRDTTDRDLDSATNQQQRQEVSTFDINRVSVVHAPVIPTVTVVAPDAAATAAAPREVTDLFVALGLRPSAGSPTRPVLPLPRLIELAFVAVRRTFFNATPTARLNGPVEVNNTTGVATGQIVGADADGDQLKYSVKTPPAQGSVEVGADGKFTYTPQDDWTPNSGDEVQFTIAVSDASSTWPHLHLLGGGHEATYTVTFSYAAVNHAPDVTVTGGDVQPDGTVKYTVSASDQDGDALHLTSNGVHGTLTQTSTSQTGGITNYEYTFTPDKAYAHDLSLGGNTDPGVGMATFTVSDGRGGTDTESRTVSIAAVNAAPEMTVVPGAGSVYTITVTDDDGDPIALTPSVTHGTLTGGETATKGVYQYTFTVDPAYAHDLTKPGLPDAGTAEVGFRATDGHGGSAQAGDTVPISGVNAAPVLNVTEKDGIYTVEVRDDDTGDVVTVVPTVTHGTLTATKIDERHYQYTFTIDPAYAHSLTANGSTQTGTATVQFVAADDHQGVSATYRDDIVVTGVNSAPTVSVVGGSTRIGPDGKATFDVKFADADGDAVTNIGVTAPSGQVTLSGVVNADGSRTVTYTANYADAHALGPTGEAPVDLTFTMSDGHTATATTQQVAVTIVGLNHEPTVKTTQTVDRATGTATVTATWRDLDGPPDLGAASVQLPTTDKGVFAYDEQTGELTFTPTEAAREAASVVGAPLTDRRVVVTFTVTDPYGVYTKDVAVLIAPLDNAVVGTIAGDRTPASIDRVDAVVVAPDGTTILVANANNNVISRINAIDGTVEDTYTIGTGTNVRTRQLVVSQSADNPVVYALGSDNTVWKIDAATGEIEEVELENPPLQIAVSPDGSTLYYASFDGRNTLLRALDADGTVSPITLLPDDIGQMAVDAHGNIVIDNGDGVTGYTVIDPDDGQPVDRGATTFDAGDFAVSGGDVWVVDAANDRIVRFATGAGTTEQQDISVRDPSDIVVSPDGQRAYVVSGSGAIVVLDLDRDARDPVIGSITGIGAVNNIAISPDGTHLYVTGRTSLNGAQSDTVTIISISPSELPADLELPSAL